MRLLGAVFLAVQVVQVPPGDSAQRPIYLHVGIGVDSRLTLTEPLVRVEGRSGDVAVIGLSLLQTQPHTMLGIRPREAGVARLLLVGQRHVVTVVIEASRLGTTQQVALRVDAPSTAAGVGPGRTTTALARPDGAAAPADATEDVEPEISTPTPSATHDAACAQAAPGLAPCASAEPSIDIEPVKRSTAGWVVRVRLGMRAAHAVVRRFELDGRAVAFDARSERATLVVEGRTAPTARRPLHGLLVFVMDGREQTRPLTLPRRGWLARLLHRGTR